MTDPEPPPSNPGQPPPAVNQRNQNPGADGAVNRAAAVTIASDSLPADPRGSISQLTMALPSAQAGQGDAPPIDFLGYRLGRLLGSGGMGMVYEAYHERLKRQVALKLLRPEVASRSTFSERFLRESKTMAAVNHPAVVSIFDAGEHMGYLYMALEYIPGGDLSKLVARRGTVDAPTALRMMIRCAQGLMAIHAAGLVHRDIKPQNIFLDRDLHPKIGDLGLARAADGEDRMTKTGSAWGTPAYMSPEQVRGVGDIDIRSDIYALGATLYTILTGTEPFTGNTSYLVTHQVLTDPAPDPRLRNLTVPPAVAAICLTCMAKDRSERYQTPEQLHQDLQRALDGKPLLYAGLHTLAPISTPSGAFATVSAGAGSPGGPPSAPRLVAAAQPATPPPSSASLPAAYRPAESGFDLSGLPAGLLKLAALGVVGLVLYLVVHSMQGQTRIQKGPQGAQTAAPATADSTTWAQASGVDSHGRWADLSCNGVVSRFRWIPSGSFFMGSPEDEAGRDHSETRHRVSISAGFWLSSVECTQAQWAAIQGTQPDAGTANLPQTDIDYQDCLQALDRLSAQCAPLKARLPTEAEWEYACRAGSGTAFPHGPSLGHGGWSAQGSVLASWKAHAGEPGAEVAVATELGQLRDDPDIGSHPVAQRAANDWGLFDMNGNALEWCADAWDGLEALPSGDETDPIGQAGGMRICRGGSWWVPEQACRSAARRAMPPGDRHSWLGMRILIGLPGPASASAAH